MALVQALALLTPQFQAKPTPAEKKRKKKEETIRIKRKETKMSLFNDNMTTSKIQERASLVAQWLRIHLPVQGTRVRALVREDPTCRGATKPLHHDY